MSEYLVYTLYPALAGFIVNWLFKFLKSKLTPKSVTNLRVEIRRVKMKVASVKVLWAKSVSENVKKQILTLVIDGLAPQVVELAPDVQEYGPFDVDDDTTVHVELVANNGTTSSEVAMLDFIIIGITPPEKPTGLDYQIIGTKDKA